MKKRKHSENEYVRQMPLSLQEKLRNEDAFIKACEKKMIAIENGIWISRFANKSVLSYFCGRCFCGDSTVGCVLIKGKFDMPLSDLEKMFGVTGLENGRKSYLRRKISDTCKDIDILFDKW